MPKDEFRAFAQPERLLTPGCTAADLSPSEAEALADAAAFGLSRRMPDLSAHRVLTAWQVAAVLLFAGGSAIACAVLPHGTWPLVTDALSLAFLAGTVFRAALALVATSPSDDPAPPGDASLPIYSVIVPLFREANVLPRLAEALLALDYPRDRLDIKLVVEEDDAETTRVAASLCEEGPFELIVVPRGEPRTKPRACNFALNFARGEFAVIYDAEDRPEHDQLRKAVAAFCARPQDIACLQARLNFYNATENVLTKLFALDYALWFDVLLPALDRLGVPMPLGGTSNHFRTAVLRTLGGWDPFNVTEDADLGIRISQLGMRVSMLDSTTFEEAPVRLGVWMRQRSRWMKGYMQTWLVHTRQPFGLVARAGWMGFLAFHLFIGGSVASSLATVPLWLIFFASIGQAHTAFSALPALALGNVFMAGLAIASPVRRGWRNLSPYGLGVPFYWMLISLAAWRGLFQLATRPFYWEKTPHGLSAIGGQC